MRHVSVASFALATVGQARKTGGAALRLSCRRAVHPSGCCEELDRVALAGLAMTGVWGKSE